MKRIIKTGLWSICIMVVISIALLLTCNQIVIHNAKGKVFSELDSIAPTEWGLLLGTTPQTRIGNRQNMFFKYRIDAAEQLYKAGKVSHILISGDENSLNGVNEPQCMKDSLVARGDLPTSYILTGKVSVPLIPWLGHARNTASNLLSSSPNNFITNEHST